MKLARRELLALIGSIALPAVAFEPLLAKPAPAGLDPVSYLISEKLDGVRALWDGQALRFRSGRSVAAPAWFTTQLPREALDGELWMGRQRFDPLSAAVRRNQPLDEEWRQIKLHAFELPAGTGRFAQRAEQLRVLAAAHAAVLVALPQFRLPSHAALAERLAQVVAAGGEGLMLHHADAPLASGRSDWLLKLKPQADAEALVLGHEPGKGRLAGLMGALEVQTPEGVRFKLGSGFTDAQRRQPPPVDATVTYRYRDLTPGGKPRFATFLRVAESF